MAKLRELSVNVPIRFSEKAQKELYETCMGYKKLAEVRGEENAKLRDAMYSNAKRHGLQHMGADELRAWATRQAELIAALRKVAKDMYPSYCYANGGNGETYLTYEQDADIRDRMRELGVLDE